MEELKVYSPHVEVMNREIGWFVKFVKKAMDLTWVTQHVNIMLNILKKGWQ